MKSRWTPHESGPLRRRRARDRVRPAWRGPSCQTQDESLHAVELPCTRRGSTRSAESTSEISKLLRAKRVPRRMLTRWLRSVDHGTAGGWTSCCDRPGACSAPPLRARGGRQHRRRALWLARRRLAPHTRSPQGGPSARVGPPRRGLRRLPLPCVPSRPGQRHRHPSRPVPRMSRRRHRHLRLLPRRQLLFVLPRCRLLPSRSRERISIPSRTR